MSISKEQLAAMMGDKGRFNWSSGNLVPVQEPDGAAGADTENKGNEQSGQRPPCFSYARNPSPNLRK